MQTAKLGLAVLGEMNLGCSDSSAPLFIVDRTQAHVDLLNKLRKKAWGEMSEEEQEQWYGEATKGAYNYTDLNRVESAVAKLASELGLTLSTKTDWTLWDVPVQADMERYLSNVAAIRDACPGELVFPVLPNSMGELTYEGANSIEMVLLIVHSRCAIARSGELYCGEV